MNARRILGFYVLLAIALLFLWASVTGAMADMAAAVLAPAYLEEVGK